jgi:maltooligosyltrehalose trehalohydrolase
MREAGGGYFEASFAAPGKEVRYFYVLDGDTRRPDPASRFQPEGVHGPSEAVRHDAFGWTDGGWKNPPLEDYMLYELHVGAFTPEGTFEAVIHRLPYLRELGVNAIELMPVSQFPGPRNWGYDGVYPFAVQQSYGGPGSLKALVNACHLSGLAVVLDVVYNHLGPEGNYLRDFGPYFTGRYSTPWGDAVNFDGPGSDGVRRFFIESSLYWLNVFHIDALRIDAVHGIFDMSARHFLDELREEVQRRAERKVYLIPESDLNDVRIINPTRIGGYGLDAQWNDDFHHALHTLLTGEQSGYYRDFGGVPDMAKAIREGFVYSGQHSRFRDRRHGSPSAHLPPRRFVVFSQNHDQVGNRPEGDRLAATLPLQKLKLAAAMVLLSPSVPLLFMGEEYGETAPFRYFVSHSDPDLIEAIREGRKKESSLFGWTGEAPDPQEEAAFLRSRLNPGLRHDGEHKVLFTFYRELIRLRKSLSALRNPVRDEMEATAHEEEKALTVLIGHGGERIVSLVSFNDESVEVPLPPAEGAWKKVLDSSAFRGPDNIAMTGGEAVEGPVRLNPFGYCLFREEA